MPIQVSYPGVYVQEIPGGQPVVSGVSTASTAFVDFFPRGPMGKAERVVSMNDVERIFGGLHTRSEASYGLRQYFLNGGQEAWVIRTGDGRAVKANRKVPIKTPGLPARVEASLADFQAAQKAAQAAAAAAKAAQDALTALQQEGISDQAREQGTEKLRSSGDQAAAATREAAAATRKAAVQARAASDELALAIAKVAAASGPVADRTQMAAQKSADAADAASKAAEATSTITQAAEKAAAVATAALQASQAARAADAAAREIEKILAQAAGSTTAGEAVDKAAGKVDQAVTDKDISTAQQQAVVAASQAMDVASQVEAAAQGIAKVAQNLSDTAAAADKAGAKTTLDAAQALLGSVKEQSDKAGAADWAAQTAATPEDAQKAAQDAKTASDALLGLAGEGEKPPASNVKALAATMLQTVLARVNAAGTAAQAQAGPLLDAGDNPGLITLAVGGMNEAISSAKTAVQAAVGGAEDARVAADSVTSGGPGLAARAAVNNAGKAKQDTIQVVDNAKSTRLQVFQSGMKAQTAGTDFETASKALTKLPDDASDAVAAVLNVSQAALNAADNTVAAAESVEKAAVTTSTVSVRTSQTADVAAQAAEAAVYANREAISEPTLTIEAINEGVWGDNLEVTLKVDGVLFSLSVREVVLKNGVEHTLAAETYNQLTVDETSTAGKKALEVVNHNSNLIRLSQFGPKIAGAYPQDVAGKLLDGGNDGGLANADQLTSAMKSALDKIEPAIFNLLCLPAVANYDDAEASVAIAEARAYCAKKRAFFIIDVPAQVKTVDAMLSWVNEYGNATAFHSAVYFPRLVIPDPLNDYRPRNVGPSGTLAGIYSRTDTARGVWKAPAGIDAVLQGAEVAVRLNDDLNGLLNPRGVNVLRSFPIYGNIAWGARTLAGADALSSEYKYINVRRLMNYIEESIFQSMKWAVFEPNNETLWGKIRLQINGFLAGLFSDGAFQGATPAASYFVRCDGTTTTPLDIDMGVVNVVVGVAPVKPAEFIILQFQQIAGQAAS